MLYNKTLKLLVIISMIFLFACNQSASSCKLDKMCDEYQRLVDKLMSATNSGDYTTIMDINQDVQNWLSKWENAIDNNSCTPDELLDASNRMMSIANSLY